MEVGQKTLFLETPRLKGPGAVHSSDRMPWVPLNSLHAPQRVLGQLIEFPSVPPPSRTLRALEQPPPLPSQLDYHLRLGCRELENPRPQSPVQPEDLFTQRPLSRCHQARYLRRQDPGKLRFLL